MTDPLHTQTETYPRGWLRHHPEAESGPPGGAAPSGGQDQPTRLALDHLTHVAAPTVAVPVVPVRTTRPPDVTPPGGYRTRVPIPTQTPAPAPPPAPGITSVADNLAALRVRRIGPGGLFGWRPTSGPSLAEVAAARSKIAEEEERRRIRHIRHMDALEILRGYLGILALILLTCLVALVSYLAFGLLVGWYAWGPTQT